jgi:hypothetical protein
MTVGRAPRGRRVNGKPNDPAQNRTTTISPRMPRSGGPARGAVLGPAAWPAPSPGGPRFPGWRRYPSKRSLAGRCFRGLAVPSSRRSCRSGGCSAGARRSGASLWPAGAATACPGCAAMSGCIPSCAVTPLAFGAGMAGSGSVRASTAWGRGKDGGSTGRLIGTGGSRPWPAPGTPRGRDPGCLACAVWSWPRRSAGAAWSCGGACAPPPSSAARMRRMTDSASTNGAAAVPGCLRLTWHTPGSGGTGCLLPSGQPPRLTHDGAAMGARSAHNPLRSNRQARLLRGGCVVHAAPVCQRPSSFGRPPAPGHGM